MIFFIIILLFIFFTVILLIKPRCPECGGTMYDIDVHNGRIVYKCNCCGIKIDRDLNAAINLLYLDDSKVTIINA